MRADHRWTSTNGSGERCFQDLEEESEAKDEKIEFLTGQLQDKAGLTHTSYHHHCHLTQLLCKSGGESLLIFILNDKKELELLR